MLKQNKSVTAEKVLTKELTVKDAEKQILPFAEKVRALKISNPKDMEAASEYLSQLNAAKDAVTARMETITKPAKEAIKAAEAIWKPFISQAKDLIDSIRRKQGDWQTEQVRLERIEKEKIANRVGEGKGKLKMETAMRRLDEMNRPATKIATASGSTSFREDHDFEVMDVTMLPIDYVLPNEVKIRAAMKAGIKVEGVRYFTRQVPVNRR